MTKATKVLIALLVVCLLFAQGILSNTSRAIPASISVQSQILPNMPLSGNYVPAQILVGMQSSVSLTNITTSFLGLDILSVIDLTDVSSLVSNTAVTPYTGPQILLLELESDDEGDLLNAISALETNPLVSFAEPNLIGSACSTIPSDPLSPSEELWGHYKTNIPEALEITTGNPSVLLGYLDSGIEYHPALIDNISDTLGRNFLADNPYFPYTDPYDFLDDYGHGTSTSGLAGLNGIDEGMIGVSPGVTIVPLKILDGGGIGSAAELIRSLVYADHSGISIVNLGAAWYGERDLFQAMEIAVSCYSGIIFAPAGNSGKDNDFNPDLASYPASFSHLPNLISVAASNPEDTLTSFSCYGQTTVALCAPGSDVLISSVFYSWDIENCDIEEFDYEDGWFTDFGYEFWAGSSIASSYVAGAAALLKSVDPNLTTAEIRAALLENTDYCPELDGLVATNGRLNAYQALLSVIPEPPVLFCDELSFDYSKLAVCLPITAAIPNDYLIIADVISEGEFDPGHTEQIESLSGSSIYEVFFAGFEGFEISICEITVKIFDSTGSVLYAEAACNTDIIHAKK